MATIAPVTDTLARFVTETDFSTIPEKACANAKMHMLDTLGTALAAVSTPVATIALTYSKRAGNVQEASIWGTETKASVPMAAFANGILAHALDFDDWDAFIHLGHPSSMVFSAALTLGETAHASGKDLLKAYVLGIEFIARIGANAPNVQRRGFHSTPIWGSLGATVACASVLKLYITT